MLARALLPFADHSKDSVARILRDSHSIVPPQETAVDAPTGTPTFRERPRAGSATVEGWGTDAERDRGKRRVAQLAIGIGTMAVVLGGSFVLLQRSKEPSPSSSDSARVVGTMPIPAVTPNATVRPAISPPEETAAEPSASAPEVTPAVHPSADVHRRLAPKPPRPAPATSSNKVATPPSSPLDGRK
jgi:hypothetical protein